MQLILVLALAVGQQLVEAALGRPAAITFTATVDFSPHEVDTADIGWVHLRALRLGPLYHGEVTMGSATEQSVSVAGDTDLKVMKFLIAQRGKRVMVTIEVQEKPEG